MQISIVLSYAFLGLFNAYYKGGKAVKNTKKIKKNYNSTEQIGLRIKMGEKAVKIYMGIVFTNS